jgi:hypothetical protein
VSGRYEWKRIGVGFVYCFYIGDVVIKGGGIPLTDLNPPNDLSVLSHDLDLQRNMSLSFCFV